MRRILLSVALLASTLVPVGAARAADVSLTPLNGTQFPDRAFVLNLPPGVVPQAGQLHVTEGGIPVSGLKVAPAAAGVQKRLGEILVVDTSGSMRGAPLAAAMKAARTFASHRLPAQPLAVVAFSNVTTTILPFTSNATRITDALAVPPSSGGGTHIYDAVQSALGLVQKAKLAGASLVVLSDGSDRGSVTSSKELLAAARALHVRIYSVGLRSSSFAPDSLRGLANGTSGEYSEARSSQSLVGIYQALGSRLANQYVIRYRSLAGPHTLVKVSATAAGLTTAATAHYTSPALSAIKGSGASGASVSTVAVVGVSAAVALLLAVAIALALRSRESTVTDRIRPFVPGVLDVAAGDEEEQEETMSFLADAERRLESRPWAARIAETFEIAQIPIKPLQLAALTLFLTGLTMWALAAATGHALAAVVGLAIPFAAYQWVKISLVRRRRLFSEQLADNLQIVASALRSGHGFVGALRNVVHDAPEPSGSEFRRVLAEEQLGTPLEEALGIAVHRMASEDLSHVALVATVQRETGGNAAEVLERVVDSIRERVAIRRLVRTLTAQGRFGGIVVSSLPPIVLVALTALNPSFMSPLYSTTAGNFVLLLAGMLVILGWFVIRRIIDFEV
jgi:tight adherence protein B